MRELALHLLDIAENSVAARAANITIDIHSDTQSDRLKMSIRDDGCGMDAVTVARVTDPFVTSRTTRKVGLGLPFLKMAAEMCNGGLDIQSKKGEGTQVTVEFQLSHIDRMPMGDLGATFVSLLVGSPQINWIFRCHKDGQTFQFESAPILELLDGVPLTEPGVLAYLREMINTGVSEMGLVEA